MNFGPVLPARLSFHPSHHPRDFLRVPEWSYGSSKRLSLTRIKLSLPPIKALRVAPKPPAKKEKRLSLEGVTPAPKVEDNSASGDVNGVVVPDKDASAPQTTAVEALQLLKKMRETRNPGGAFTSSDKKADALDEEFSEDPFLDSLRCVLIFHFRGNMQPDELGGTLDGSTRAAFNSGVRNLSATMTTMMMTGSRTWMRILNPSPLGWPLAPRHGAPLMSTSVLRLLRNSGSRLFGCRLLYQRSSRMRASSPRSPCLNPQKMLSRNRRCVHPRSARTSRPRA